MATTASSDVLLERLLALHPKLIDLSLARIERLLDRLGNPERDLPPTIHLAGTNGKGSTAAFLVAMLAADGARVDCYTSPHLVRFHERIALDREPIEEPRLAAYLARCEEVNEGHPITFFEITTAAAFLAFAESRADWLVLETGLGGRLDATNVLERPALTILTAIDYDHADFLGDDLAGIAREKAGILKPGVEAVVAAQQPAALAAIEARARDLGVTTLVAGRDWSWRRETAGLRLDLPGATESLVLPDPNLPGPHQAENAALAAVAASRLGIDAAAIASGMTDARWPARLQRLRSGPLVDALPRDCELWLDGGHNPSAGRALAAALAELPALPLHLVYGLLKTKEARGYLEPLLAQAVSAQAVAIPDEAASLSATEAAAAGAPLAHPAESLESALAGASAQGLAGRIWICGSLYLAGQVLRENA